jgi:hypothetical protein
MTREHVQDHIHNDAKWPVRGAPMRDAEPISVVVVTAARWT